LFHDWQPSNADKRNECLAQNTEREEKCQQGEDGDRAWTDSIRSFRDIS
jgi:hypothetical protein